MKKQLNDFHDFHLSFLNEILNKSVSEEEALLENNLFHLINEGELDQPDVEELRKQTKELEDILNSLSSFNSINKLPAIENWVKSQKNNISLAKSFVAKLDLNKPKKGMMSYIKSALGKDATAKNGIAAVALISSQISGGMASLASALELLERNLKDLDGDFGQGPLKDIPVDSELNIADIQSGIAKSFKNSLGSNTVKQAQSLSKKLSGVAAKIPNVNLTDFPLSGAQSDILNLTLEELSELVSSISNIPPPPAQVAKNTLDSKSDSSEDISTDKIGKAAEAWLAKLKKDGANDQITKIARQWMSAVSRDPNFKKIAGLKESFSFLNQPLLNEQVAWQDLLSVFKNNVPPVFKGAPDKDIESLIYPFAIALANQGIEVTDKSGKKLAVKKSSIEDVIDNAEKESEELFDKPQDSSEKKKYKSSEFESKLSSAFNQAFPDADPDAGKMLALSFASYAGKDIDEIILETKSISYLLNEKYNFDNVFSHMQSEIGKWAYEAGIINFEGLVADFLRSTRKVLLDDNVAIEYVPKTKASDKPASEKQAPLEDENAEMDIEDPAQLDDKEEDIADAEAQKMSGGLGTTPIDKNSLAGILKSFPDIIGSGPKATRARRNLRKAINTAAGMEVFAEGFDYWEEKSMYLLKESYDYDPVARWKKLAGIKKDE